MKINDLRKRRNTILKAMRASLDASLVEGADAIDQEAYDAQQLEVDNLNASIERMEQLEAQEANMAIPEPSVGQAQAIEAISLDAATLPVPSAARHPSRGVEAKTQFESIGDFLTAVVNGGRDQRLEYRERDAGPRAEQRMDTATKGGFMVPTQFLPTMLRIDPAGTPLLNSVRTLQPGTPPDSAVSIPALDQDTETNDAPDHQYGGIQVGWTGEGGSKPETDADFKEVYLEPEEVSAHVKLTEKLKRNWPAVSSLLGELLGQALNGKIEQALFDGDGAAKPHGILSADALYKVARTTANTIVYADVANMSQRLLERGGSPFWLVNRLQKANLMQMANSNGNLIWVGDSSVPGSPGSLDGKPVFFYENAPALGALGDVMLINPDYYLVKPGSGPFVAVGQANDDFIVNKERIKIFSNIDGSPWLKSTFKERNGNEISPFIALDVPSS